MSDTTRDQLLQAATRLFANKGFYGASLANIADELQLSKQALLHHFGRKEQLYGEVLQSICTQTMAALPDSRSSISSEDALRQTLLRLYDTMLHNGSATRLLMRELLDNEARASEARSWYLQPLLDELLALARQLPSQQQKTAAQSMAGIYQLLGAINYFAVSQPTLTQMLGPDQFRQMQDAYPAQLAQLIQHFIED